MSYDLSVDIETLADGYHLFGYFRADIHFHTVSHIEYLVHLLPVGLTFITDNLEERRNGEHVILDHTAVVAYEMQHLGLRAAGTVNHTVNLRSQFIEHLLGDRTNCPALTSTPSILSSR